MKLSNKIKKITTMLLTCSVIATSGSTVVNAKEESSYKASNAENLNNYMVKISEDIGVRLMGTPNEKATAEYIKNEFGKIGYDAEIQEYKLPANRITAVAGMTIGGKEYYGNYYYGGEMNAINNPVISNQTLSEPQAEDLECIDGWNIENGSVVVVNNGLFKKLENLSSAKAAEDPEYQKLKAADFLKAAITKAETSGAAAIVVYNDETNKQLSLKNVSDSNIPVLAFNITVGKLLVSGEKVVKIDDIQRSTSWNVCAVKKANTEEPKAIIHITGHLDSVMGSMGATDNASSVAAMLELAKLYRDVNTGAVELRFVAVGGEEGGLNGSKAYAETLTEEETSISINFNMDMLSTSWTEANAVSLDISNGVFNIAAALIVSESEELNWLEGTENVRWFKYGGSDHVSFQNKGIDAASMIRTTDFDDDIEPQNHTADDTMAVNYSKERLEECTNMVSKGIARAIDDKLSKVVECTVQESDNTVKVVNAGELAYLYDEILFAFEKEDGTIEEVSGVKEDEYAVTAPEGTVLVSAKGIGEDTANVKGTFNKAITEKYTTGLVVKDAKNIPADYSAVNAALAKIPEDLSQYTDASVKVLLEAKEAVIYGKNITEQAEVNAMAEKIEAAINGLEKKSVKPTNPENKTEPTDKPVKSENSSMIKTGDTTDYVIWLALMIVSLSGVLGAVSYKKVSKK